VSAAVNLPGPSRRSIRLQGYDYADAGAYFVTVCAHLRECLFGTIAEDAIRLSAIGELVSRAWFSLPGRFSNIELDAFVVMPNHLHGIIVVERAVKAVAESPGRGPISGSLGAIVQNLKSTSAFKINRLRGTPGQPVWQRNYYEHIIRDDRDLTRIRNYIDNNIRQWAADHENPSLNNRLP
jgi:REP element-mobilizing transposase RayT